MPELGALERHRRNLSLGRFENGFRLRDVQIRGDAAFSQVHSQVKRFAKDLDASRLTQGPIAPSPTRAG